MKATHEAFLLRALVRGLFLVLAIVGCQGEPSGSFVSEAHLEPGRAIVLQRVGPNAAFDKPVDIRPGPNEPHRLYVAEQTGRIRILDLARNLVLPDVVLDVTGMVHPEAGQDGKQVGLLAFAMHPNWPGDDRIFTNLVDAENNNLILQHHANDPGATKVLLSIPDAEPWHNAGQVLFGPDGMLYIGVGDGCAGGCDCKGNAQNLGSLRGKILRIDVNAGDPYAIPPDNPQAPGMAPEVWLWGIRNPWRISFDRANGDLYFGDVGDKVFEEANVFPASHEASRNFGWPILEGSACLSAGEASQCGGGDCTGAAGRFSMPIVTYNHEPDPAKDTLGGCAVIGGYVYRGGDMPDLQGAYLYADHCNGWVRSLHRDESQPALDYDFLAGKHASTFGEDLAGEIYVTDYWPGHVYKLTAGAGNPNRPRYTLLSETGLEGGDVHRFSPAYHLWSDGAAKQRWIWLPPDAAIDTTDMDHWEFPVGTKVWKEFSWGGRKIETRLIERWGNGPRDYFMGAFVWNDDGSDAVYMPAGAPNAHGSGHDVPATGTCITCHGGEPGRILGVSAVQLSRGRKEEGSEIDLRWLVENGKLTNAPPADADFSPPGDEVASSALGYLHANCGGCHNPKGSGALVDQVLRVYVDEANGKVQDTRIFRTTVTQALTAWHSPDATFRIAPGSPDGSGVVLRMARRGPGQMPPVATKVVDPAGLELLRSWIGSVE